MKVRFLIIIADEQYDLPVRWPHKTLSRIGDCIETETLIEPKEWMGLFFRMFSGLGVYQGLLRSLGDFLCNGYFVKVKNVVWQRNAVHIELTNDQYRLDLWEDYEKKQGSKASIENSFNIIRDQVEALAFAGDFFLDSLNQRLKKGANDTLNTAFKAKIMQLKSEEMIGNSNDL